MFYGRATEYKVEKPVKEDDGLGYEVVSYEPYMKTPIYIVIQDRSEYQANDLDLYKTTVVAYTDDKRVQRGMRVDGRYVVTNAYPHRYGSVLYMEEVENG